MVMVKTIMVQGTSSDAGKSVLVTALCRIFKQDGYKVAPFKAQNMALNAFVTREGGEIGRAQAVQAEACGIEPSVDMNPVLIKPEADSRSQIVVHGRARKTISAAEYHNHAPNLIKDVMASFERLSAAYDVIVIEGAGSPAEINFKHKEIVNMRMARLTSSPVLLVADIDRGGVFASLFGTVELLDEEERNLIKGFIINKFRGDESLLKPGIEIIEQKTGIAMLGIIPYFRNIAIAQEDSVYLDNRKQSDSSSDLDIAIIRLPRICNYDDFDPLEEEGLNIRYVNNTAELGDPDLIIVPGTKSTIADLGYLRQSGLAEEITGKAGAGTPVIGICGGYQMLGRTIHDPDGVESDGGSVLSLGLLDAVTTFAGQKSTTQVKGRPLASHGLFKGIESSFITGYEIHMGLTENRGDKSAFHISETPDGEADYEDGTINDKGTVFGTYIHGIFHNNAFRRALLNSIRRHRGLAEKADSTAIDKEREYDKLAELIRRSIEIDKVYEILERGA